MGKWALINQVKKLVVEAHFAHTVEVERDLFYSNINHYFVEYGESEEEEEISDVEIVDVFASPAKYPCHPYYSYEYLAYERSDSK